MRYVMKSSVECYVPEEGRKVNLWSLVVEPEAIFEDVQGVALRAVKDYLETAMERHRDALVGLPRHGRCEDRSDYRNGYYLRKYFDTAIGRIEQLRIPRCRKQSLVASLEAQLKRTKGAVETKVVEMFLKGLSVRDIGPILDGLLGLSVSPGQVSRLARTWDGQVAAFHRRRLGDRYVYLFLDGVHLKRRSAPRLFRSMARARHKVVLAAYGITSEGVKELIGFRLETSESEAGWRRFLMSLYRRGLEGDALRLIVTDGGAGLLRALDDVYPETRRQRCWFHKMSNVVAKVRKAHRSACLKGLRKVYTAANRAAAERAFLAWARAWRDREAAAVRCIERDLEALLAFFALPKAHWRMARTTNGIERCFREVRRRTRSVGCFVNDKSLERMVYGLFRFMNEKRAGKPCPQFKQLTQVA